MKNVDPSFRENSTTALRTAPLIHRIDPGFVNHRKIETLIKPEGMKFVDEAIARLPAMPDWERSVRIGHIYTEAMQKYCKALGVESLEAVLINGRGRMFCSTESLAPCKDIYEKERVVSRCIPKGKYDLTVELEYSTHHVKADTLKSRLRKGGVFCIIADVRGVLDDRLLCEPYIIGQPWVVEEGAQDKQDAVWFSFQLYENFIEDIDEFSEVRDEADPPSPEPMSAIKESAFKQCLAEILGDAVQSDWGGETSDYYSAHIHLAGRRTTAAFLLKGPAKYSPMQITHLGKNGDQIYRLSKEPAELLIVQHCHDILPAVRETLRVFAVQPSKAKRYCLIDGRDSLRLLRAYGLYDKALALSK